MTNIREVIHMDILALRTKTGLSQKEFCTKYGLELRTYQDWEQQRKAPNTTAITLLKIIDRYPDIVAQCVVPDTVETYPTNTLHFFVELLKTYVSEKKFPHIERTSDLTNDLELDSIDRTALLMDVEEHFEFSIPEEDAESLRTVGDYVTYIDSRLKK